MSNILLDTHALVWSLLTPNELSKQATEMIEKSQKQNNLFIASISLWEIAMLVKKRRLNLYEPINSFLNSINQLKGINIIDITPNIAADSVFLDDFHGDPADRLIVASTRELSATLITRDNNIIDWAKQGLVKIIRC